MPADGSADRHSDASDPCSGQQVTSFRKVLRFGVKAGTLIDFETTGRPGKDPTCEVVTLGQVSGQEVAITQRCSRDKEPFYSTLRANLSRFPRPFYAYNAGFEESVLRLELGISVHHGEIIDLMEPWRNRAQALGLKWPKLDELISEPESYFGRDQLIGSEVPRLWNAYLAGGPETLLQRIVEHNLSDLLRESILLLRFPVRRLARDQQSDARLALRESGDDS